MVPGIEPRASPCKDQSVYLGAVYLELGPGRLEVDIGCSGMTLSSKS